jgi:hypothetical protein
MKIPGPFHLFPLANSHITTRNYDNVTSCNGVCVWLNFDRKNIRDFLGVGVGWGG